MKAFTHSASGDPASRNGEIVRRNCPLVMLCRSVISNENSRSLSSLLSFDGYKGSVELLGGSVLAGLGDVRANTRAAATASAYALNSPAGVTYD